MIVNILDKVLCTFGLFDREFNPIATLSKRKEMKHENNYISEKTSTSPEYKHKHGLCFYIETAKHKMLFDLGSDDLFLKNAQKLNIDIQKIDIVIISHGHVDQGGALKLFLKVNQRAKVYVRKRAFEYHYTKYLGVRINVGLDQNLISHPQIILTDKNFNIDDELHLFSGVKERSCYSSSNNALFTKTSNGKILDDFDHEQNLIICENNQYTLFAGCAHNGIVNIQKKAEQLIGSTLNSIVSGFHLFNPISKKYEKEELIHEIGLKLKAHDTKYFTCHCTGEKAFQTLRNILGDQIQYLAVSSSIEL